MFEFRVKPDGARAFTVTAKARHIVAWEKLGGGRALSRLTDSPRYTDLYELAFVAAKAAGKWAESLEDFTAKCDVEPIVDEDSNEANPTQPGA